MIRVYNKSMQLLALLNNAFDISYDQKLNNLWTAEFSLPADDTKNEYCLPFNFVEIFDGNERVDLFRIMPVNFEKNSSGLVKTYSCEHVIATLFDDIMFKYHQATETPKNTINYILGKQSTERWKVGTVDFTTVYSYKWENENLFNALFGIAKAYDFDYQWTWNTSTYPWTINLIQPSSEISAYVRYRKNLKCIT
jgi:phage minor structural protein